MSWTIFLTDDGGGVVSVEPHREGAIYSPTGSSTASMNVTFNYSYFYYNEIDEDDGIRWLDGKRAGDTISRLESAVETLGAQPHEECKSYWCPSIGRAGSALATLLEWARENPDATWMVMG